MSDVRRTVSAAPPPRRSIEVPEPTEEGSHKLNLDGFQLASNSPSGRDRGPRAVPEGRRVSATGMTKTTIQLPNRLVGRLRAWKAENGTIQRGCGADRLHQPTRSGADRGTPQPTRTNAAPSSGLPPLASTSPQGGHGRGTSGPGRPVCAGRSRGRSRCHRHRTRTVTLTASHRASSTPNWLT